MRIFNHNLSSPPWNSPHRALWQSFESEIPSHLVEEPRRRQSSLPCLRKKQGIIQQKARLTQMFHKYVGLPTNGAACVQNQHFWLILEVQRELLVESCKDMTQEISFSINLKIAHQCCLSASGFWEHYCCQLMLSLGSHCWTDLIPEELVIFKKYIHFTNLCINKICLFL